MLPTWFYLLKNYLKDPSMEGQRTGRELRHLDRRRRAAVRRAAGAAARRRQDVRPVPREPRAACRPAHLGSPRPTRPARLLQRRPRYTQFRNYFFFKFFIRYSCRTYHLPKNGTG